MSMISNYIRVSCKFRYIRCNIKLPTLSHFKNPCSLITENSVLMNIDYFIILKIFIAKIGNKE